jgi:hypothetical protein
MPLLPRAKVPVTDFWRIFGHSWFNYQTGPTGDQTGRVDGLLRGALDIEFSNWQNFALNGAEITVEGKALGGWARLLNNVNPPTPRGSPYAPDAGASLLCYGINDLGMLNGSTAQTKAAIISAMRCVISRCRASVVFEDSDLTRHAYGAGFTNLASDGSNCSGTSLRWATTTTAATITFTIPADYKGEPICFNFIGQNGPSGGTVTFSGSAGITGTLSTSDIMPVGSGSHCPVVRRITNLTTSNAGQTIIMTVTALDASGNVFYDGCWLESLTPPPTIVLNIARLTAAGYANALYVSWTGTEGSKDADIQAVNTSLASLIAEFDGMVQLADMDKCINKDATKTSDGIHPNELGSGAIIDEILIAVQRLTPPVTAWGQSISYNPPAPRSAAIRRPRIVGQWQTAEYRAFTTYTPTVGDWWAIPLNITESRDQYNQLATEVTTAGTTTTTIRWGIYDDPAWKGYPQQLLPGMDISSGGAFTLANSTGVKTSAAFTLTWSSDPGLYWLVMKIETKGTSQVLRGLSGPNPYLPQLAVGGGGTLSPIGWKLTGQATGVLPQSFPVAAVATDAAPLIALMKSK